MGKWLKRGVIVLITFSAVSGGYLSSDVDG